MRYSTRALLIALLLVATAAPAGAWNKGGHMVTGAIAYQDLRATHPDALRRIVALLEAHPHYASRWRPQLRASDAPEPFRDSLYLFMLAARWPDDVRGQQAYHRGSWHYINLPYLPPGQSPSVQPTAPPANNILSAIQQNLSVLQSGSSTRSEQAIAVAWLFHLIGDLHQPLHTSALFSNDFRTGDAGGTLFYIRPAPGGTTISLHGYWDDLIIGRTYYRSVRNRATALRTRPGHARADFPELANTSPEHWARVESFTMAQEVAYRRGTLRGSRSENNGVALPADYAATVQPLAERRAVLAGYRLADLLRQSVR